MDGEPSAALIEVSEERSADLLVLGAKRERSVAERLLGTVATEVTKRAACDVLIVRPDGATEEPAVEQQVAVGAPTA